MVSIVQRLLVLNTFQKPPKSWLLNKSGYISREVNNGARTVFAIAYNLLTKCQFPKVLLLPKNSGLMKHFSRAKGYFSTVLPCVAPPSWQSGD